jgi:NAD(P)-dependent dehydrogenase (short-subunit alcohol dehydrogenase family)
MLSQFHSLPADADPSRLAKLRTPLGMSEPAEVAALIAFIASDEGRYMTGSIVAIDGGLTV